MNIKCSYNSLENGELIYRPHLFCECSDGNKYQIGMVHRNENGEVKIVPAVGYQEGRYITKTKDKDGIK